jgi:flagellar biosynthetic protein FlhB
MAENENGTERSEAPTGKRRGEAHDEGRIAKSPELATAITLLGALLTLQAGGPGLGRFLQETLGNAFASLAFVANNEQAAVISLRSAILGSLQAVSVILGALVLTSVGIGAVQARGVFTLKPLEPKFDKLNPIAGLKKIFSIGGVVELVKSLAKMLVIGLALYTVLRHAIPVFGSLVQQDPRALMTTTQTYAVRIVATAGFAFLALGVGDFYYQRWQFEESLKMTKDEVKQENKSNEGDPMVKARRRSIGRDRVRQQMFKAVPTANVVIVNPTHIAIALRYDPSVAPAPIVVAMGQRKVAERIKQLALESGVPIVENKPLARAMIKVCSVGMMVPADMYAAIAEVLAFVYRRRAERAGAWAGSAVV